MFRQQHVARTNDPAMIRPAQSLRRDVRAQQIAKLSSSSRNYDRLGRRAKEKMLDKVRRSCESQHWIIFQYAECHSRNFF